MKSTAECPYPEKSDFSWRIFGFSGLRDRVADAVNRMTIRRVRPAFARSARQSVRPISCPQFRIGYCVREALFCSSRPAEEANGKQSFANVTSQVVLGTKGKNAPGSDVDQTVHSFP